MSQPIVLHPSQPRPAEIPRRLSAPGLRAEQLAFGPRQLHVAALVPERLLGRLRAALGGEHQLATPTSWQALALLLEQGLVDVVVVDPSLLPTGEAPPTVVVGATEVPLVLYTAVSAASMRATLELAQGSGVRRLVLAGLDDSPSKLRSLLESLPAVADGERFVRAHLPQLAKVPPGLAHAIVQLFRAPAEVSDVETLAERAGMPRRNLDRWLHRAGLPPGLPLVIAARVLRAHGLLLRGSHGVAEAAEAVGYTARTLGKQARAATGLRPTQLRAVTARTVAARLGDYLQRHRGA